jgi:hypothetical protein
VVSLDVDVNVDGVFDVHTPTSPHAMEARELGCFALRTASSSVLSTETLILTRIHPCARTLHQDSNLFLKHGFAYLPSHFQPKALVGRHPWALMAGRSFACHSVTASTGLHVCIHHRDKSLTVMDGR